MTLYLESCGEGSIDLVLLHGWGFNGAVWSETATVLADHCRLHIPDLPGFGRSPLYKGEYSLPLLARCVAERVPPDSIWLGWSLGAMVAIQAALDLPERVKGLILTASGPRFTRSDDWPNGMDGELLEQFAEALQEDFNGTIRRFIGLNARGSEHDRDTVKALRRDVLRFGKPDQLALSGGLNLLRSSDLRARLGEVACPTTVILGERDTLVPQAVATDLARLCPRWPVTILKGAGHAPFLSHPEPFISTVLRFIDTFPIEAG